MSTFTTAGLGVIPGTDGDVDTVVRSQAWLEAHPGGTAGREESSQLSDTARWAGGEVAATADGSLGSLMDARPGRGRRRLPRSPESGRAVLIPGQLEADRMAAADLGCEVDAHPLRPGVVVARKPTRALWLLEGAPDEVRAEVRSAMMREFVSCLGTLGQAG